MKNKKAKVEFYRLIIFMMKSLNNIGKSIISSKKPFYEHENNALMYFEKSYAYLEKYFPRISGNIQKDEDNRTILEDGRENIIILPREDLFELEKESNSCLEYINDIKSGKFNEKDMKTELDEWEQLSFFY